MRILLFGTSGQVGWELQRALQPVGVVTALSRAQADFDDPESLRACFASKPDVVVNAVAYTAVDQAETNGDRALRINAEAVGVLAEESHRRGALLIHFSTDYVFDGTSPSPYRESDAPHPASVYGRSKLLGETAIQASRCDHLILRTSWVFSRRGKNFVRTILRLAHERDVLKIVADQIGAPTGASLIADVTAHVARAAHAERSTDRFQSELLHLTASGSTSWHGLAEHIVACAGGRGVLAGRHPAIVPITTAEFPLPARRPLNSRLDTTRLRERYALTLPDWAPAVASCVEELIGG